jgi:hypothetical protein
MQFSFRGAYHFQRSLQVQVQVQVASQAAFARLLVRRLKHHNLKHHSFFEVRRKKPQYKADVTD